MSTIHEALKRAQKERDTLSLKYRGIVAARGRERGALGRGTILGVIGLIVFIFLAFVSYSWLDFRPVERPAAAGNKDQNPAPGPRQEGAKQAEASYERARNFHKSGDLREAKRHYLETLGGDPGHVDALNNLGVIYLQNKEYTAAQASFEKALRLRPGHADPFYNLACLYALRGQIEEGLTYLQKAVVLNPSVRDWARRDRDLDHLRKSPEFEKIISQAPPSGEGAGLERAKPAHQSP